MPRGPRLDVPGVLPHVRARGRGTQRVLPVERVIERVCQAVGVRAEELRGSGRRAAVSRARAGVAYLGLEWLGQRGPAAARALGVQRATVYEVARRGRQEVAYWEQLGADVKPDFPCNLPQICGCDESSGVHLLQSGPWRNVAAL